MTTGTTPLHTEVDRRPDGAENEPSERMKEERR
jgi:hypothetical protein